MKTRFILACAAAGVAVSVFGGPPASAENAPTGSISFQPGGGRPGDTVEIFGTCSDPAFTAAPLISDVLEPTSISGHEDGAGRPESAAWSKTLKAYAIIKGDAKPGRWKVSFKCGTRTVSGQVTVDPTTYPRASITVSPEKGVPGTKVNIGIGCETPSSATSAAFTIASTKGTVKDVKPGVYKVSYHCGAAEVSTNFTVLEPKAPARNAQVPVKPKGAAETGDLTEVPTDQVPVTALLIGGAIVLLASAGLGTWWVFRRRD